LPAQPILVFASGKGWDFQIGLGRKGRPETLSPSDRRRFAQNLADNSEKLDF
jgi:hypothetical protein